MVNKESGKVLIAGFRVEGQWRATTYRGRGLRFLPGAQMHEVQAQKHDYV